MKTILYFGILPFILCMFFNSCKSDTKNETQEASKSVNSDVKKELDSILNTVNSKYPEITEKEFYCFSFIGTANNSVLGKNSDVAFVEKVETEQYQFIDSISAISYKKIAYFFALKNNDTIGLTDKFIRNTQLKNVLVLNNTDKLFSTLCSLKKQTARNLLPAIFIIDKNGNLAYYSDAGIGNKVLFHSLSNFIKSRQN